MALLALIGVLLAGGGCARREYKPVEDVGGGQDVSTFALTSLAGTRDGDKLHVRARFAEGERELALELRFQIGPQTRLESGTWKGLGEEGKVRERSTTFLGGQSGPPSIGGRYDLFGSRNTALYCVTIPLQPLADRL